ncbi:hypothetical protein GJAV_G00163560 [Gymnothorax javanicus]|nr:hypothetical protein GJAV_G00163560 [Gymnothorax javanicus]
MQMRQLINSPYSWILLREIAAMPTDSPNTSKSRGKTPVKSTGNTQSKQSLQVSQKRSSEAARDEMASEQQSTQNKEKDVYCGSSDVRRKICELEKDKLELYTQFNEEVSSYQGELVRLRAALERGEAQRQKLEYEIVLVKKEAMVEKKAAEEMTAALQSEDTKLRAQAADWQQRLSDMEKALSLTRRARDEDQRALELELEERDRLLISANTECDHLATENKRIEALLQSERDAVSELCRKVERLQAEREREAESLRRQSGELHCASERERRLKTELEAAQLRVKTLEENVESERAAHLESKFSSEIIQLRIQDLEAALQVEKSAQVEALSNLELMKHKFAEIEKAYEQERDKAKDSLQQLAQREEHYLARKNELIVELNDKKKTVTELTEALQAYEMQQGQSQINLEKAQTQHASLTETLEGFRRDLQQALRHSGVLDPRIEERLEKNGRADLHTLVDSLRKTLTHYQDSLEKSTRELHDLKKMYESATQECKLLEDTIGALKKNAEEAHLGLARADNEVTRLRAECLNLAAQSEHAQSELSAIRQRWKLERERGSEAEMEIQRLTQHYQKDSQEKLTFLHDLYQRLVAGCVLIKQPQGLLGTFSWPELQAVLQEHAEALNSDLSRANEKISHLEFVCQNKSEAVRELQQTQKSTFSKLEEQMRRREEDWQSQKRDLEKHYSSLSSEAQARAKKWQGAAELAKVKADSLEKVQNETAVELARLQNLLPQTRRERATLLAACALLTGALCPLYWQLCSLASEKALLLRQLDAIRDFEAEIRSLVGALTAEGKDGERSGMCSRGAGGGARTFRKYAIAVMAARRFLKLGQRSQMLFSLEQGLGDFPALSVHMGEARDSSACSGQDRGERLSNMALHWFQSKALLDIFLSTVGELQDLMAKAEPGTPASHPGVLAAARSCFARLMERLMQEMDGASRLWCREKGALSARLGQGLHKLNKVGSTQSDATAAALTTKGAVAVLQRLVLEFTQRLHSSEVERRSLRLELAELKCRAKETSPRAEEREDHRKTAGVPVEHFGSMCAELSSALEREQQAHSLLHEQALLLKEMGLGLELHSGEEAEKDKTLAEAVKSLSEAKTELRRKDQSLRQLGRRMALHLQEKRQLEESVQHAESALRQAARNKDALSGYLRSVESSLNDVKERILLSRAAVTREDFTLQLPRMHLEATGSERLMGGAEMAACQSLVSTYTDVYQMACCRMALLEKEVASHQSHISDLKNELQDACLRESQCFVPVRAPSPKM